VPVPSPAGETKRLTSSGLLKGFPMQFLVLPRF
jgi:hypothetical protein